MTRSCCAVGCSLRAGTNKLSQIKFFRFPLNKERRTAWIQAVRRENWLPSEHSLLCSKHFILGKPSKDSQHPDWVPTIFQHNSKVPLCTDESPSKKACKRPQQKLDRYERVKRRRQACELNENVLENEIALENDTVNIPPAEFENSREKETQTEFVKLSASIETQTDLTMHVLEEEMSNLREEVAQLKKIILKEENALDFEKDNKKMKFYTGITCQIFNVLLSYVLTYWKTPYTCLSPQNQFLLVLMRLRLDLLNEDLAYRFKISMSQVCLIFHSWLEVLAREFQCLIVWPNRKTVEKNLPSEFKKPAFKNVRCIIDCSEVFIERPTSFAARSQTYSFYKHHNTLKFLVAVTPSGAISFMSRCWGGRVSDKELTKKSGFLEKIEPGDLIMADRGFNIDELIAAKQASLCVPAYTKGKSQLTRKEVEVSRQLARVRIHVERVIGQLKTYRILNGPIPISLLKRKKDTFWCTADKMLLVCAALINLQGAIIKTK